MIPRADHERFLAALEWDLDVVWYEACGAWLETDDNLARCPSLVGVEIQCITRQEVQLEATIERLPIGSENLGAGVRDDCRARGT